MGFIGVPLQTIETRLQQVRDQIRRLEIERDILEGLRRDSVAMRMDPIREAAALERRPTQTVGEAHPKTDFSVPKEQSLRSRIIDYVSRHPGRRSVDVAEDQELLKAASNAKEPRKMILTVVGQLVDANKLRRDDGKLFVAA